MYRARADNCGCLGIIEHDYKMMKEGKRYVSSIYTSSLSNQDIGITTSEDNYVLMRIKINAVDTVKLEFYENAEYSSGTSLLVIR